MIRPQGAARDDVVMRAWRPALQRLLCGPEGRRYNVCYAGLNVRGKTFVMRAW